MPKENTSYNVNMETEQEIHGEILTLLRGYSSYELAKKHGFVGTEEEYLASLVGEKGEVGNGIENVVLNDNYTITINYTNGDSYTIPTPIRGEKGETGNGIESATLNPDYTLTLNFTNGGNYTTPSIRGLQGERGLKGDQGIQGEAGISISRVKLNPDYTLTIYFTDETSHTTSSIRGIQGEKGETGRGIEYVTVNADYSLTFKYTDGKTYNTPVLRGIQGVQGEKGDTGNGISSAVLNQDYTLTLNFTDGSSFTTSSIRGQTGERGEQGIQGEPGKGIVKTELNSDYTLTISFSDGSYYTTPPIRGERGIQGEKGKDGVDGVGISSVKMNQDYTLTINFDDGTHYTTEPIRGEKGEKGDSGDSPTITTTKSGKRTTIYADNSPIGTVDDGDDGTTPSITASKSGSVTTISVNGNPVAEINDGTPGQDGVSPSATVTQTSSGATITITDKTGTTTATVTNGQDGDDGYSPSASVSKSGSTATITITDKNGTTTAEVHDGQGGTGTIDPTPTEGSTNAVSSGGVYDELTDVKSDLNQTELDIKREIIDGYVSITSGTEEVTPSATDYSANRITPKNGAESAGGSAVMNINGAYTSYYTLTSNDYLSNDVKRINSKYNTVMFILFCYSKSDSSYVGAIYKEYTFKSAAQLEQNNMLYPYTTVDMDALRQLFPDYKFRVEITDTAVNHDTQCIASNIISWCTYTVPASADSRQLVMTVDDVAPDENGNVNLGYGDVINAMESSVDELVSMKNGLFFDPISEIENADVDVSSSQYTYGKIISSSGCIVSVYCIEHTDSITIKRYGTTSVLALVSNTLYSTSDVPTSNTIPTIRYVDGNEYTYENSSHYKYLYICSARNSTPSYSVFLSADGYPNIGVFIENTNNSITDINEEITSIGEEITDINDSVDAFEDATEAITYSPIEILENVDMEMATSTGKLITLSGSIVYVYDIREMPALVVRRPSSPSVMFLLSNYLFSSSDIPQTKLPMFNYTQGNECVFTNPNGYRYMYITVKRGTSANYSATVTVGFNILNKVCELNRYVCEKYTDLPSDIVCTYKNMYVANHLGELRFSNDDCHTWTKTLDVSTYGIIKSYHLFDNGCIAFFTHQKAYYSEDWVTIYEATVYEQDGTTAYSPSTYDNFTTTKEAAYRKYLNGQDWYVFGNYGITDENNTRRNIYGTFDNGHSYRVLYEFNIAGSETIRHVHTVIYNPNFDKFLCLTGDSTSESHVFEFSIANDTSMGTFTALGNGTKYKWAGIEFYGEDVYYCLDQTPGVVLKSKYKDLSDLSKHEIVLDNLPNDAIGLFIGERGDMLVTISKYRSTGQTNSPFSVGVDCLNIYYSSDRKNFEKIHTANITNSNNQIYYGFYSPNSDGRILSGVWPGNVSLDAWDKLPSVDLAYIVKKAGYPKAFKPYNKTYEVVPVLSLECDDFSVEEDSEAIYTVKVFPFNATVKTWEIVEYDSDYLTVSGTIITGRSAGNTQIKIRSKSNYAVTQTVNVTVIPK